MTVKAVKMPCTTPNVYTKVPDGGWGWAIAVAFFFVEALTYGVIKSFGVFFNDLMESFDETNSRISWIISICVFVQTFTGKSKGQEPEGAVLLLTQHVEAWDQGLCPNGSMINCSLQALWMFSETPPNGCPSPLVSLSYSSCVAQGRGPWPSCSSLNGDKILNIKT